MSIDRILGPGLHGRGIPRNGFAGSRAKLTAVQRQEISHRRAEGETPKALAAEYGVTASAIRQIEPHERT